MRPITAQPAITSLIGGDRHLLQATMDIARVLLVMIIPVVTNRRILTVLHKRPIPQNKSIVGDIKIIGRE